MFRNWRILIRWYNLRDRVNISFKKIQILTACIFSLCELKEEEVDVNNLKLKILCKALQRDG